MEIIVYESLELIGVKKESILKVGDSIFINKDIDPRLTELMCLTPEYFNLHKSL